MLISAVLPSQKLLFPDANNVSNPTSSSSVNNLLLTPTKQCNNSFKNENCENLIGKKKSLCSSQEKTNFNTNEILTNKLKRNINLINKNINENNNCNLSPKKKPKFLINDLLTKPNAAAVAAAALLTSVIQPNLLLTQQTNLNNQNFLPNNNNRIKNQSLLKKKNNDLLTKKFKQNQLDHHHSSTTINNYLKKAETDNIAIPLNFLPNGNSSKLKNVLCNLEVENQALWTKFHKIGTEMIITKPGR